MASGQGCALPREGVDQLVTQPSVGSCNVIAGWLSAGRTAASDETPPHYLDHAGQCHLVFVVGPARELRLRGL